MDSHLSQVYECNMKCSHPPPGFELVLLCPFPMTIKITSWLPPPYVMQLPQTSSYKILQNYLVSLVIKKGIKTDQADYGKYFDSWVNESTYVQIFTIYPPLKRKWILQKCSLQKDTRRILNTKWHFQNAEYKMTPLEYWI